MPKCIDYTGVKGSHSANKKTKFWIQQRSKGPTEGTSGLAHRTVWCTRGLQRKLATFGNFQRRLRYNSPDCPVRQRSPAQRSAAQSAGDAWPAPMVGSGHRTVRCANCHESAMVVCARIGRRSRTGHEQWLSGGAPDCPVRHPTKGKDNLPCWPPTAPSCLGAIKGVKGN